MATDVHEWHPLGPEGKEIFYRKLSVYKMAWGGIDLKDYHVAVSRNAGPIALLRSSSSLIEASRHVTAPCHLRIFASNGRELVGVDWHEFETLTTVGMAWTDREELVVVLQDGTLLMHDVSGRRLSRAQLLSSQVSGRVEAVSFLKRGLVFLDQRLRLHVVSDLDDPEPVPLPAPALHSNDLMCMHAMEAIQPEEGDASEMEVLLSTKNAGVVVVDEVKATEKPDAASGDSVVSVAVMPSGLYVALFTASGTLIVMDRSLQRELLRQDGFPKHEPDGMAWCGNDAVALYFRGNALLLVGPKGESLEFLSERSETLCLGQEIDSLRVISEDFCELIHRVPRETVDAVGVGSIAPASRLLKTLRAFEEGRARADADMRRLAESGALQEALQCCLVAAEAEFDHVGQGDFLRAASQGKCFLGRSESARAANAFVETARKLRVLNALRHEETALPMTAEQFNVVGRQGVLDRLLARRQHLLALRVCDFLRLPRQRVLVHWACEKIRASAMRDNVSNRDLCDAIHSKLATCKEVSYAGVARAASDAGRSELAIMLLECEPRASDQIPLLLNMGAEELALRKAVETGDAELVSLVLLHLKRGLPQQDADAEGRFFALVAKYPPAVVQLRKYCRVQDRAMLVRFLRHLRDLSGVATQLVLDAYAAGSLDQRLEVMDLAVQAFQDAAKAPGKGGGKDYLFHAKAAQEQMQLLRKEAALEEQTKQNVFMDLSVSDCIHSCSIAGYHSKALRLKSEFKVPDPRFWHLRIRALSESRDWPMLKKLANEKRSPVGYRPFVEACIREGAKVEAKDYIAKLSDPAEKMELYTAVGAVKDAAEIAARAKDVDALRDLRRRCAGDGATQAWLVRLIETLE